jgi:hypothetical protein
MGGRQRTELTELLFPSPAEKDYSQYGALAAEVWN